MSKSYYLIYKALHDLPKFASKTQRIQVGNGQYVGVLFVILVIIEICSHRLEVFTLVSEIFDNVDMVLRIKIYLNWRCDRFLGVMFQVFE